MWDQAMQLFMEYLWAPILALFAYLWTAVHRVEKKTTEHDVQIGAIVTAVAEAKTSRKEIYDKVETVRAESSAQHSTLRKEQREDFKELRELVSTLKK